MDSIFKKQFLLFTGVLIISFSILAVALTQAFRSFFVEQRKDMLIEQGENISKVFAQAYYVGGIYSEEKLNSEIDVLDEYLDSSFIFITNRNEIAIISNDIDTKWLGKTLDITEVELAMEGNVIEAQGNMGGIYDKDVLTVGYPIIVENRQFGAIFMNSPMTELNATISEAYRIITITTSCSVLLGFILVYFSSKQMSKPLREITEAAKVIADGNFELRISTAGRDEISRLAESFNEMAESLNDQEIRRKEFISNVSHDLRSPLTSIIGFLRAILDGTVPESKRDKYLRVILDETERLSALSNNILDVNSLDYAENALSYSVFDINELIRKTAISFENRVYEKKIGTEVIVSDTAVFVNADYDKIHRVLYNLFDNAVKFTQEGGKIKILAEIKGERVYISVTDNGRGVSDEERKRLFERFYKADSSRGLDKRGSGLGLSIVKEFVKAHNSKITVKSEIGKGCCFTFFLDIVK